MVLEKCQLTIEEASSSGLRSCRLDIEEYFNSEDLPCYRPARTGLAAYILGAGGLDSRTLLRMGLPTAMRGV